MDATAASLRNYLFRIAEREENSLGTNSSCLWMAAKVSGINNLFLMRLLPWNWMVAIYVGGMSRNATLKSWLENLFLRRQSPSTLALTIPIIKPKRNADYLKCCVARLREITL